MGMTQGHRQRIGSIGLRVARQFEQLPNHVLYLLFVRRAGADHRLLDLPRRVFGHLETCIDRRHYGCTAGLPQFQG